MRKPTRSTRELQQILTLRLEALPGMIGKITDGQRLGLKRVRAPLGHANWTASEVSDQGAYRLDAARVIRQTQREFDLEPE